MAREADAPPTPGTLPWAAKVVGIVHGVPLAQIDSDAEHLANAKKALQKKSKGVNKLRVKLSVAQRYLLISDETSIVASIHLDDIHHFNVDKKHQEYLIMGAPCIGHTHDKIAVTDQSQPGIAAQILDVIVLKFSDESALSFRTWLRRNFLNGSTASTSMASVVPFSHTGSVSSDSNENSASFARDRSRSFGMVPSRIPSDQTGSSQGSPALPHPAPPMVPRSRARSVGASSDTAAVQATAPAAQLSKSQEIQSEATPVPTPATSWTCEHCTFANAIQAQVCEICEQARGDGATPTEDKQMLLPCPPPRRRITKTESSTSTESQGTTAGVPSQGTIRRLAKKKSGLSQNNAPSPSETVLAKPQEAQVAAEPTPVTPPTPKPEFGGVSSSFVAMEGNQAVAFIFALVLLFFQIPLAYNTSFSERNQDPAPDPSYRDLFEMVLFPEWPMRAATTAPRLFFSLLTSKYMRTFEEGTFLGDNFVLVMIAGVVFGISLISSLSSLSFVRRFGSYLFLHKVKIVGSILLGLTPLLLHEALFYFRSPIFAHFRAFVALMFATVAFIYGMSMLFKINKFITMTFYVELSYSTCSMTMLQLSREISSHPVGCSFPITYWAFYAVGIMLVVWSAISVMTLLVPTFRLHLEKHSARIPFLLLALSLAYRLNQHTRNGTNFNNLFEVTVTLNSFAFCLYFLLAPNVLPGGILIPNAFASLGIAIFAPASGFGWLCVSSLMMFGCLVACEATHDARVGARVGHQTIAARQFVLFSCGCYLWTRSFFEQRASQSSDESFAVWLYETITIIWTACGVVVNFITAVDQISSLRNVFNFLSSHSKEIWIGFQFTLSICEFCIAAYAPLVFQIWLFATGIHLFVYALERLGRVKNIERLRNIFLEMWNREIALMRRLYVLSRRSLHNLRPVFAFAIAALFFQSFVEQPQFKFVSVGFVLAALTSSVISLRLLADVTHSRKLESISISLYRNLDFGVMPLLKQGAKLLGRGLRVFGHLLAKLWPVILFSFRKVTKVLFHIGTSIRPLFQLIFKALVFLYNHPALSSLVMAVALAAAYFAHEHGYAIAIPPVWDLFGILLDTPWQIAMFLRSFAPEAIDFGLDVLLLVKGEVFSWISGLADASVPSWHLLKSSSFAWAFYFMNISISRTEADRAIRLKVVVVPASVIYLTLTRFPQWFLPVIGCLLIWLVLAIQMDLRRMQERYEAEARLRVLRAQGRIRDPSTFAELKLPAVVPEHDYHNTECIICMDSFDDPVPDGSVPQPTYTSPCGHCFHQSCLVTWFNTSKNYKCPTCRQSCNPTTAEYMYETIF